MHCKLCCLLRGLELKEDDDVRHGNANQLQKPNDFSTAQGEMLNLDTNSTFGNKRGVMSKSPAAVNLTDD